MMMDLLNQVFIWPNGIRQKKQPVQPKMEIWPNKDRKLDKIHV
jgi:hypothetical protein